MQDLLSVSITLPLALYLVYPKYLFNMVPAYIISRRVETLRIDGYLNTFDAWEPCGIPSTDEIWGTLSVRKAHPSLETYSYKCAAGLKTLLVEYLLMQNRNLTGEEKNPKTREELREVNGGIPLLTDLCLAFRGDQRARGGNDLYLRTRRDICLPGSARDCLPTFSRLREPDQHFEWYGVPLDAESKLDRRRKKPEDQRGVERSEWRHTSSDRSVLDPLGVIRGLGEVSTDPP